jgi:hypothetical protein
MTSVVLRSRGAALRGSYVGDPGSLEKYIDGARKMQGLVGSITGVFSSGKK